MAIFDESTVSFDVTGLHQVSEMETVFPYSRNRCRNDSFSVKYFMKVPQTQNGRNVAEIWGFLSVKGAVGPKALRF
ncbi:MAG: hypothetical protein HKO04_05955 [Silicimonas sp.]|nr:hypothetical protein [Silicimonas sp.]